MATIRKRGDKWQVQIRRTGQAPVSRSFQHKRDASAWARQMELKADRQDLPVDIRVLERTTLGELVERYRDTVTPRKKGAEVETIVLNAFLRQRMCRKMLSELRPSDFAVYRDTRLETVRPATLKRQWNTIRHLFEVAKTEWSLPIKQNPIDGLGFKAPDQRRERRLREGEWERLIEAARLRKNPYIVPIIALAVETGMRRGEILGMSWEHYNAPQRSLLIPKSKNGHGRTIPLTPNAIRLLDEIARTEGRIFPVTANAFRLAWDRVKGRAGIDDLHFHDLRHEAVSRFFEKGLTMPEVALISGHRDFRMLYRYAHAAREAIADKLA